MKKIAIIEDDKLLNEALARTLTKAGFEPIRAFHFDGGIDLIEEKPSLMIIDINLPGGEGFEILRRAREYGEIPAIFLTARDEEEDMIRAFDLGADDYLVKPFPMKVLLKHVEAVLRRTQDSQRPFQYRGLIIDFDKKKVSYENQEIKLTAKEYKLLELLAGNKGRVITKELILERIWDAEGSFVEENTVNVTLARLKKKIEPDPAKPIFIRNVFGLGYIFGE